MANHPSSSGERAPIIGYSAQYRISAEIIYSALVAKELEWIALPVHVKSSHEMWSDLIYAHENTPLAIALSLARR